MTSANDAATSGNDDQANSNVGRLSSVKKPEPAEAGQLSRLRAENRKLKSRNRELESELNKVRAALDLARKPFGLSLETEGTAPGTGTFASRLDRLFELVRRDDGEQYAPQDVADTINEAAGEKVISGTYVWQLRTGRRTNPTRRHMLALALFFGVPPAYFFDDGDNARTESTEAEAVLRDDRIRDITLRTVGLSERSLKMISDIVDNAREIDPPSGTRTKPRRSTPNT